MGKFNKTGKRGMPELNTSSLPDLIFTMLFFFMIVTTMREVTLKVQFKVPQATELEKLELQNVFFRESYSYSLPFSKLPIISRAVIRVVVHRVGKSTVLNKPSA